MARCVDYAKIPMQKNDIGAKTIGEYFEKLLLTLWDEQEAFSGKRPFGNSGWEYDVYASLIAAGVLDGSLDEEGYVEDVSYSAANDIVCNMIKQIFASGTNDHSAGVVEVVRCKNCEHGQFMPSCSMYLCRCTGGKLRYADDYCNYGERKEQE
jgi:hypothetical protein